MIVNINRYFFRANEEAELTSDHVDENILYEQLNELCEVLSDDQRHEYFTDGSDSNTSESSISSTHSVTSITSDSSLPYNRSVRHPTETTVLNIHVAHLQHTSITTKKKPKKKKKAKSTYKHVPHSEKEPHLVEKRNARERKRVMTVNNAFSHLQKHVPCGNRKKRISKVKTLKIAIDYIYYLQDMIDDYDDNMNLQQLRSNSKSTFSSQSGMDNNSIESIRTTYSPTNVPSPLMDPVTGISQMNPSTLYSTNILPTHSFVHMSADTLYPQHNPVQRDPCSTDFSINTSLTLPSDVTLSDHTITDAINCMQEEEMDIRWRPAFRNVSILFDNIAFNSCSVLKQFAFFTLF